MSEITSEQEKMIIEQAVSAQQNAYIPYSKFPVGAALLNNDGQIFRGVNVENASYGGTICAERSAICSAISTLGPTKFKPLAIAVATDLKVPGSPCGICRQFMAEFGNFIVLLYARPTKQIVKTSINELLPMAFKPEHLDEHKNCCDAK